MSKNIWIINHNATPPQIAGLCRHYYFSKYLRQDGYNVRILTASTIHNTKTNFINDNSLLLEKYMDSVPYTFLRCASYSRNGISRIRNILEFPIRVWQAYKKLERPDVIYTSSPDIFSALSAVLLAKYLHVPSILEIRDLWPESIVCYKNISPLNPIIMVLRMIEKWLYKNCDRLIFTIEGGYDYIKDQKWDDEISKEKVFHINNGVDLDEFDRNIINYKFSDSDLENDDIFKIVYTGSIRLANNVGILIDVAKFLQHSGIKVLFIIYGDGTQKNKLENRILSENINNVIFKGNISKDLIPYVLSKSNLNVLHYQQHDIWKYGGSQNKLFEYLSSGKPVLSTIKMGYDIVTSNNAGIVSDSCTVSDIAHSIEQIISLDDSEYSNCCKNARVLSEQYDYKILTTMLKKILMGVL